MTAVRPGTARRSHGPARTSVRAGARRPVASAVVRRAVLLPVALLAVLTSCRADATVAVRVRPDGAGTVTVSVVLDAAAVRRLGDPAAALRTKDLTDAGWTVPAPVRRGGGLTLQAVRRFRSAAELTTVLDEVGGRGGVFRGTSLTVGDSVASTVYDFRTTVHLDGSLEQFSDSTARKVLGGLPLGWTAKELVAAGATRPDAATLALDVALPGAEQPARWRRPATGGAPVTFEARTASRVWRPWSLGLAGLGVVLLVAGVVLGVRSRR